MKMITGKTRLACLLGSPVKHSRSPLMHNTAFELTGIDAAYLCFDVGTEGLAETVRGLKTMNVMGFNLTMPDKSAMVELCDELDTAARIAGSVNTVVNKDGRFIGYTTDGVGFTRAAKEAGHPLPGKKIVLLGAGGAASAVLVQAALDGAEKIHVFNRPGENFKRAERIISELEKTCDCRLEISDLNDEETLKEAIKNADILINGTSVGMAPKTDACLIKEEWFADKDIMHAGLVVSDLIYEPAKTRLLSLAEKSGLATFNGMYMLLYQGAESFRLWTGCDMPDEVIKNIYFSKKNIYLTGFMGTGKSTVARFLSERTGLEIAEMDELIVGREGKAISRIFEENGEEYFRKVETELLAELADKGNMIVSCGGGVAAQPRNVEIMKDSGRVVMLSARPETVLKRVENDNSRPLLEGNKNAEYIAGLMEKRRACYIAAADVIIDTDDKNPERIAGEIIRKIY